MAITASKKVSRFRPGKELSGSLRAAKPATQRTAPSKPRPLTAEQRAATARAKRLAGAKKKITALKTKQAKQLAAFKTKLAKAFETFKRTTMAAVDKPARKKSPKKKMVSSLRRRVGMNKSELIEVIAKKS